MASWSLTQICAVYCMHHCCKENKQLRQVSMDPMQTTGGTAGLKDVLLLALPSRHLWPPRVKQSVHDLTSVPQQECGSKRFHAEAAQKYLPPDYAFALGASQNCNSRLIMTFNSRLTFKMQGRSKLRSAPNSWPPTSLERASY